MTNFFWDLYQNRWIAEVSARTRDAGSAARSARDKANDVERRIDALILTNMAMWSFLSERLGVTEEQLLDRMTEIDLSDGKLDGKARGTSGVRTCSDCGKPLSKRHPKCFYCGAADAGAKPFGRAT
ncbi:MAG: hypothetical protein JNM80_03275 [Phycisphaerae bacterium]|nr:hypothetical protein [Phycisphaerae bacterium]